MLIIVAIMLCGIAVGYLLRNWDTRFISHVITALIWLLLFLLGIEVGSNPRIVMGMQTLGIEVGSNPRIVGGMQTLGIEALLLTIGGAVGTTLCAWLLWIYVSRKEASK